MKDISLSLDAFAEKALIYLIREELKSRKLFGGLRDLGLDDSFYQADLLEVIMPCIGFSWDQTEQYDFCYNLLNKHSVLVGLDGVELLDEARRVYDILSKQSAHDPIPILKATKALKKALDASQDCIAPSGSEMKLRERWWQSSRAELKFIGSKLRWFRKRRGLGIESAAKRIRIPKRRLNRIERGSYVQFDLPHLRRICRCYGTSAEAFIFNFIDPRFHYSQP